MIRCNILVQIRNVLINIFFVIFIEKVLKIQACFGHPCNYVW
jgi:hypothetical protein